MKVRFHLLNGKNFMKWQIIDDDDNKSYLDPNEVTLTLYDCYLHNNPNIANKIYSGKTSKDVCSWIDCREIEVEPASLQVGNPVFYNPKIKPYWFDSNDNNIDGYRFDILTTNGNKVIEPASIAV